MNIKKNKFGLIILTLAASGMMFPVSAQETKRNNAPDLREYKKVATEVKSGVQKKKANAGKSGGFFRAPSASSPAPQFECALLYSDAWMFDDYGVYTFTADENVNFVERFETESLPQNGGGFFTDKYYYFTSYSTDYYTGEVEVTTYKYDKFTGSELDYFYQDVTALASDMSYDPIDNVAYGCFYGNSGEADSWGYMDLNDCTVTHIGTMNVSLMALAINLQGEAYGITNSGDLVKIDKKTGATTTIGYTGYPPEYMQSAAFSSDGKFYWAASSEYYYSSLFEVNLNDGSLTQVVVFPNDEEIVALNEIDRVPESGAPAMAQNLTVTLNGDSLDFGLSFEIPTKTYGGGTLSGSVDYYVSVDGASVYSGSSTAGSKVSTNLKVAEAGYHFITVVLNNSAGDSQTASLRKWIGIDEPQAVGNVKMEQTGDKEVTVTWTAPKAGVNGGYFDASRLSYTIVRLPDNKVVAAKQKELRCVDNISDLNGQALVRYTVTPYADNVEGSSTISNGLILGNAFQVPVTFSFDTVDDYNIFTVIDNNETVNLDSGCWLYSPSGQVAGYNCGTKDGDDWLITPSIYLYADRQYVFSFDVCCYSDYWPDEYAVYMGDSPTIPGMKTQLVPRTTIYWDDFRTVSRVVTVAQDGEYYFGFHALSEAGGAFFLIDDITINEGLMLKAPAEVTDLKAEAQATGNWEATISFNAPDKTVDGSALSSISSINIEKNGEVIHTVDNPATGEAITFTDKQFNENGMAVYTVTAFNSNGAGSPATAECWVGVDNPSAPLNPTVVLNASGNAVISWEKPQGRGTHGGYVDNNSLTYTVYNLKTNEIIAPQTRDLSVTDNLTTIDNTGSQSMYQYAIVPSSEEGYGQDVTALYIAGAPYDLPFIESFKGGVATNFWLFSRMNGEGWAVGDDRSFYSQDNDNGLIYYLPDDQEITTTALSGKISVKDAGNPVLSFYMAKLSYEDNGFTDTDPTLDKINVRIGYDSFNTEVLETLELIKITNSDYLKYEYDLNKAKGCDFIVIAFEYESMSDRAPVMIDNIKVFDSLVPDLAVQNVNVPSSAIIFTKFDVKVKVANIGNVDANEPIPVNLLHNEEVIATVEIPSLEAGTTADIVLQGEVTSDWGEEEIVKVVVANEKDADPNDNVSSEFKISILRHEMPAPTNLTSDVNIQTNSMVLTWDKPAEPKEDASKPGLAVLEGYNLYHGTNLLNDEIVTGTSFTISPVEKGNYYVKAVYNEGESDASDTVTVTSTASDLPRVTDLESVVDGDDLILKWSAPVYNSEKGDEVAIDFEKYSHGDLTIEGWTIFDNADPEDIGIRDFYANNEYVEIPHAGEKQAFMVFNPSKAGINFSTNPEWKPVSGDNLLASFGDYEAIFGGSNDDWMISPELDGNELFLTFWARSASKSNRYDRIKVLCSSTGNALSDFTVVDEGDITLENAWTKYVSYLPEGTKYFAINNCSTRGYAVLIDDLSYSSGSEIEGDLIGYNAYFEGDKVNSSLIPATSDKIEYTIPNAEVGNYWVTAVYEQGESDPSNVVEAFFGPWATPAVTDLSYTIQGTVLTLTWSEPEGLDDPHASYLFGYLVYRDGSLVEETLIEETSYTISPIVEGIYTVTAFYIDGESAPSNEVVVDLAGVGQIYDDENDGNYYDLWGLKVDKPVKGHIYIHKGKKIVF